MNIHQQVKESDLILLLEAQWVKIKYQKNVYPVLDES